MMTILTKVNLSLKTKESSVLIIMIFQHILMDISHHWKANTYATCGETVHVWDHQRAAPVREFNWGVDSVHKIRFNPVEVCAFLNLVPMYSLLTLACFLD